MRAQHIVWNGQSGWQTKGEVGDPSLVLYFGTREALACGRRYELISCIGRRLLMGQRTIDEIEAAGAELGPDTLRLGFYSYGEISPHAKSRLCELHNQTMTITAFAEAA